MVMARAATFVILAALGWASGLSSLTPHTLPAARSVLPRLPPPALCTTSQHQQPADATQSEPPPSTSTGLSIAQARVLLGGVAAVYGTNYAAVKCLDTWVGSPADAATLRFALCVAVLTPIVMTAPKIVRSGPVMRDGLEIGLYFSLGYIVQALALEHSPAGIQAFLLSLTVVVCPALESLIERTKQPPRVWFAAALAAIGVAMLTLEAGSGGMDDFIGGAIGLWQPIFFGLGFYRLEKAMHTHSSDSSSVSENCQVPLEVCASAGKGGTSEEVLFEQEEALVKAGEEGADSATIALAMTAWQMVAVFSVSLLWLMAESHFDTAVFASRFTSTLSLGLTQPEVGLALLWTGIVTTAGCAFAEANCLGALSSSEATVIFSSEPLFAAAFGWLTLGETMGPSALLGGGLIVMACLTSALADGVMESGQVQGMLELFDVSSLDGEKKGDVEQEVLPPLAPPTALAASGGGLLGVVYPAAAEAIADIERDIEELSSALSERF